MEYVVPVILFTIGFAAALGMRRLISATRERGRQLPIDKGTVRLDAVGRRKKPK